MKKGLIISVSGKWTEACPITSKQSARTCLITGKQNTKACLTHMQAQQAYHQCVIQ